mgnify:CR=1 FL=1
MNSISQSFYSSIILFLLSLFIFFIIFYSIITIRYYNQNTIINNRQSLIDTISKL